MHVAPFKALDLNKQATLANTDAKITGQLPEIFTSNRTKADDFIEEVKGYFRANQYVTGLDSPICKIAITLTLIKGVSITGWVRDMGTWLDRLDQITDNMPTVWEQFLDKFKAQF